MRRIMYAIVALIWIAYGIWYFHLPLVKDACNGMQNVSAVTSDRGWPVQVYCKDGTSHWVRAF